MQRYYVISPTHCVTHRLSLLFSLAFRCLVFLYLAVSSTRITHTSFKKMRMSDPVQLLSPSLLTPSPQSLITSPPCLFISSHLLFLSITLTRCLYGADWVVCHRQIRTRSHTFFYRPGVSKHEPWTIYSRPKCRFSFLPKGSDSYSMEEVFF